MKRAAKNTLPREVLLTAPNLSNAEARLLVAGYYMAQDNRKAFDMSSRHLGDKGQDIGKFLAYIGDVSAELEADMRRALDKFVQGAGVVGEWLQAQLGIASVISAGLLAHIDIEEAETAGAIWAFAGLNPERKWEKGQKRPYNAALKQLTYHIGECFKRVSNHPDAFYGRLYRQRKEFLVARNETGYNAERAKTFRTASTEVREVLKQGKLPAGNLDRQAANYATKIFLSHLHAVMHWDKFGCLAPRPFAITYLGHAHYIEIPHAEIVPGLAEAEHENRRNVLDVNRRAAKFHNQRKGLSDEDGYQFV